MKKNSVRLTTGQIAKLHEVNKRTLHYYDNIGLFSPHTKGENGYRYYDSSQSMDFEYIRMLKDLKMSIEEIEMHLKNPSPDRFVKMAELKEWEMEQQIKKLQHMKQVLHTKKEQATFCESLQEQEIRIIENQEEPIFVMPYDFIENDMSELFSYVKDAWSMEQIRMVIGGFISLDKIRNNRFDAYDGLYTPALNRSSCGESRIKPKGTYLCGYQRGTWDKLPGMYEKMIAFAKENKLGLTGYAYELGLNEFVISDSDDYVTQIMIKIGE